MFALTKEHTKKLQEIAKLADTFSEQASYYDENNLFVDKNIRQLQSSGYTALTLPKKYGGQGADLYELLLLQERLAQGCASTALAIGWHLGIVYDLNQSHDWKPEIFAKVMEDVKEGKLLNAAATEAGTGSPTRGGLPETSAVRTKDGWKISGRKIFTTLAPVLDYFLVTATITDTSEAGQFLIPADTKGVQIEETWNSTAMRGTGSHDLVMEHAVIPEEYLLTTLAKKKMKVNGWLLHIPACYLGIAQAAHNYAISFAKTYTPNSLEHPIAQLLNIQTLIGESELELKQARHFLYSVASKWETAEDKSMLLEELAAVKHAATNTAIAVVDRAMRVVGARSLWADSPLQRYYRDVRAGLHNPPMDDATISLLAKAAINMR